MLIGHKNVINKLNKAIENNQVAHAYIFSGTDGIGKKIVARNFVCNLLCNNDEVGKNLFIANTHPDYIEIEPNEKKIISVDMIRDLSSSISIKPIKSKYKAYVINNADKMNPAAQNALLKTFEEPPVYAVIILVTSKYNSLLTTIKSRGQLIEFSNLSNNEIKEYINNNNIKMPQDINEETFYNLLNGSIGSISNVLKDIEIIKQLQEFVKNINTMNIIQSNNFGKYLMENRENIQNVLDYLEVLLYTNNKSTSVLLKYVEEAKNNIKRNINFEISMDNLLMKIREESNA